MPFAAKLVFLFLALGVLGTAVVVEKRAGTVTTAAEDGNPFPPKP